jgi:hypothetical protein
MDVACPKCGAKHWVQEQIDKKPAADPRFNMCCLDGAVDLPPNRDPPPQMRALWESPQEHAVEFRRHARAYNAQLAFTSCRYQEDHRVTGYRPFQIQGELYHLQGPLENEPGVAPQYAQIWFYDPEYAGDVRLRRNPRLDPTTLGELTGILEEVNQYIPIYRTARELMAASRIDFAALRANMTIVMEPGADRRRENLPTASEVAAIVPDVGPGTRSTEDLHLSRRATPGAPMERISVCNKAYLPLHYVLLYPYGEPGWSPDLHLAATDRDRIRTRLTLNQYHAYRLFPRVDDFNAIFRARRLFQQYVVDAAATIEQNRLAWINNNQRRIRADLYRGLEDGLSLGAGEAPEVVGRRVVLPSSHTGSARAMRAAFMDAMAVTGRFKKPHLFVTMTTNPNWPEITRELDPGQEAIDRPDLVARVFKLKKEQLTDEIFGDGIFGKCPARVWTIEYQKRGLPHLHMLLFLQDSDHFLEPDVIDEMVCAELPDPSWDPDGELTDIVRSAMIHGPCGEFNERSPCMDPDQGCTKRYPRAFCDETSVGEDGYPLYRRRDHPHTAFERVVGRQTVTVDNRWVVPYNPYLTRRYKCHVNVEVCSSIKVIKYLYKYIYKGRPSPLSLSLSPSSADRPA